MIGVAGSCTDCGCAYGECECPRANHGDHEFMRKMEVFLTSIKKPEDTRRCFDCLNFTPAYMVAGKVWEKAWPYAKDQKRLMRRRAEQLNLDPKKCAKQNLCFVCLEERIGRKLTIHDFQLVPVNGAIRFGYQLGSEPPTRG